MSIYRLRALALGVVLSSISGLAQSPGTPEVSAPAPILSVADMTRQTISCKPSSISPGLLPKGTVVTIRVSVNEKGKTVGVTPVGRCPVGCGLLAGSVVSINKCKFARYTVEGRATSYQGDIELIAP